MGTGTPKRRKKEGEFDRINEKHLPIPSKKTSWEIHPYLLKKPTSADTPPAKKSLVSLHTATSPSSSHLSSSSSITPTQRSPFPHHTLAHYSSSPLIDTSFVVSIMTAISVWERKKERKKGKEARMATAAMCMMEGIRARGESDVWLMMTMMMTTYH
jgi:hypothetical protein